MGEGDKTARGVGRRGRRGVWCVEGGGELDRETKEKRVAERETLRAQ